jgi:hypothetical protein
MSNTTPLMPKATAVWLVENTSMSFEQIADFCKLHPLEVKAIADGESALTIKGLDPVLTGQLTREDIDKAQQDPNHRLHMADSKVRVPVAKRRGPRYTPVSRRQDRPNAILWLLRNHPELKDAQIMRLVGTTKSTIDSVRDGTHWNTANIAAMDPVTLGLCSQIDLDLEVKRASKGTASPDEADEGTMLFTAEEALASGRTTAPTVDDDGMPVAPTRRPEQEEELDADSVFAKLKSLKTTDADN